MQCTLDLIVLKQGVEANNELIQSGEIRFTEEEIPYLVIKD